MANLTSEQYALLKTLKDALNGDGAALEAVFATGSGGGGTLSVGTVGVDFHTFAGPAVFNTKEVWEPIDSYSLDLEEGVYNVAMEMRGFVSSNSSDLNFRVKVGGVVVYEAGGNIGGTADTISFTAIRDLGQLSGITLFELEARRDSGSNSATATIEHWSVALRTED